MINDIFKYDPTLPRKQNEQLLNQSLERDLPLLVESKIVELVVDPETRQARLLILDLDRYQQWVMEIVSQFQQNLPQVVGVNEFYPQQLVGLSVQSTAERLMQLQES